MQEKENYFKFYEWMITELRLKGSELIIFAIIYGFTEEKKLKCTATLEYFAKWTGTKTRNVECSINSLEKKGFIARKRGAINKKNRNTYSINVHELSRIARNTRDLLTIVETLKNKGVTFISNKDKIDTSTAQGNFLLTVLSAVSQLERDMILERQREGIDNAMQKGVYKARCGRKATAIDRDDFKHEYERYKQGEITKTQMADNLGVSRPTLYRYMESMK